MLVIDQSQDVERHRGELGDLRQHGGVDAKTGKHAANEATGEPEVRFRLGNGVLDPLGRVHAADRFERVVDKHKCAPVIGPQVVHLLAVNTLPHVATDELHDVQNIADLGGGVADVVVLKEEHLGERDANVEPVLLHADADVVTAQKRQVVDVDGAREVVGHRCQKLSRGSSRSELSGLLLGLKSMRHSNQRRHHLLHE